MALVYFSIVVLAFSAEALDSAFSRGEPLAHVVLIRKASMNLLLARVVGLMVRPDFPVVGRVLPAVSLW